MNESISKIAILVVSLLMVGFMAALFFIPGALGATGEIVKGTIESAQDVLIPGVSKLVLK